MTDNKPVSFTARQDWIAWLFSLGIKNRSALIRQAVEEKVARDMPNAPLPPAGSAPHGVRNDALPEDWKSRLYRDRYQLVAEYDMHEGFVFTHFHEYSKPIRPDAIWLTLMADTPEPCEVTILDVPERLKEDKQATLHQLALDYMVWCSEKDMPG